MPPARGRSRRHVLAALGTGLAALAGCNQPTGDPETVTPLSPVGPGPSAGSTPRSEPLDISATAAWPNFAGDAANTGYRPGTESLGEPDALEVRWTTDLETRVRTDPVLSGPRLYVATETGRVVTIDRATGAIEWRFDTRETFGADARITHALTFFAGRVYVPTSHGVVALDPDAGSANWAEETRIYGGVTCYDDGVFFTTGNTARRLDVSGRETWRQEIDGAVTTPAVAPDGESVYVRGIQEEVFALDPSTGDRRWRYTEGSFQPATSAITAGPDHVFASMPIGAGVVAVDTETAERAWRHDAFAGLSPALVPRDSHERLTADTVVTASGSGVVEGWHVRTGERLWVRTTGDPLGSAVKYTPPLAWVATGTQGTNEVPSGPSTLHGFDVPTGGEYVRHEFDASVLGAPTFADGYLYVALGDGRIVCLEGVSDD